ncbi:hypothetical protein PX554_18005 [Sphingomonas sp. H39-1-10]|uniref:hypothetical protein n=1 Tax=Sphingomonas pollutisoli TaxID=3030829 RepID=UPI0023B9E75C|nr:hypothetical protein [Sphingomonas pollutisoli]MDF0490033.1 hypothetical protein [Sphingomonas pollutisoli]
MKNADDGLLVLAERRSDLATYLDGVEGVVEATSYEKHMLWLEYAEDADKYGRPDHVRYSWSDTLHGTLENVGSIAGRPIWISVLTTTVDGMKLLFWHITSPVADHDQCDAWLEQHLPDTARRTDGTINRTDPMNFCNILRARYGDRGRGDA